MTWSKFKLKVSQCIHYLMFTLIIISYFILSLKYFLYYGNNHIDVTTYNVQSSKIPDSFSGYRIVQLSDLHSKTFGENQVKLLKKVRELKPDIIVFTGDLVDGQTKLEEPCFALMKELVAIAPTYYIYGNHEATLLYDIKLQGFFDQIDALGVKTINSKALTLTSSKNETINLIGIPDPIALRLPNKLFHYKEVDRTKIFLEKAFQSVKDKKTYTILICHRPEYIAIYSKFSVDLALCGHTHGGQIRLPILGGLYATGQGYLPKYDSGRFEMKGLTLLINRGLGGNSFPYRIFNNPEISLIILQPK